MAFLTVGVRVSTGSDGPLLLELNAACRPARLRQQILVAEGADFHVATDLRGTRWTVSGYVGQLAHDTVAVSLRLEAEDEQGVRLVLSPEEPTKLKLNDYRAPTLAEGGLVTLGLWIHRGTDVCTPLTRAIARRGEDCEAAVVELVQCGDEPKTVVPALTALLVDVSLDGGRKPSESLRVLTAEALGRFRQDATAATPHLTDAMNDDNPYLRQAAALALWEIRANPAAMRTMDELLGSGEASTL
ncbi:MAG TPA: HEAT repeat domain-containing protein, partial [Pirellulales bacterium]|nr:HEAT repeat domain-containing protein [Pirellulales bacterium]